MGRRPTTLPPRTRLEEIRRLRLISTVELARLVSMEPSTLWRIESGGRALTHTWRDALSRELSVPVAQLYAPIGSPIPPLQPEDLSLEPAPYDPAHSPPAVADRLQAIMSDIGLSEPELARAIGGTEAAVRDWLEGLLLPPMLLMTRLSRLTGITLQYIYYGSEDGLLPALAARLRAFLTPGNAE